MVKKQVFGDNRAIALLFIETVLILILSIQAMYMLRSIIVVVPSLALSILLIGILCCSNEKFVGLVVYLMIALVLFYTLINGFSPIFLVFALLLPATYASAKSRVSEIYSSGSLSVNSMRLLRLLVALILAAIVNYFLVLYISILVLSVLLYAFHRYLGLLGARVERIDYPMRVEIANDVLVRTSIHTDKNIWVVLSSSEGVSTFYVTKDSILEYSFKTKYFGRQNIMLKIDVIDEEFFVRRTIREEAISFYVSPSFSNILRYAKTHILRRADIREIIEPVETRIYIAHDKEEERKTGGSSSVSLEEFIGMLPSFLRSIAKGLMSHASLSMKEGENNPSLRRAVKSHFGEYAGVRYFAPGDKVRNIHWKKTISKGKLMTKEFVVSPGEHGGTSAKAFGPIIIIDFLASNIVELDALFRRLLKLLVLFSKRAPESKILVLNVIDDIVISYYGKIVDILNEFSLNISKILPSKMCEYDSIGIPLNTHYIENILHNKSRSKIIGVIATSNTAFAKEILSIMIEHRIQPPRSFILIHGEPTSMKYSILRYYLESNGYKPLALPEEFLENRERSKMNSEKQ